MLKKFSPDNSKNLPITHFVMIGLHEDGGWNLKDIAYTMSYDTKAEKIEANLKEIKRTAKELKISGFFKHLITKCEITWADGTSNYVYRLQYVNDGSIFYNSIIGQKNHLMRIYCQSFRIVTCVFIMISIISQFRKKELDWRSLFSLILFGAILFYLIWEGKSIYSIPFIPFMILLMADGLSIFTTRFNDLLEEESKTILYFGLGIIVFSIFVLISLKKDFTETEKVYQSYNLKVAHLESSLISENEMEYSFYQSKKFNRISLSIENIESDSKEEYIFELYKNNNLIYSMEFNEEDISDGKLKISLEEIPDGKEKYCIRVHNKNPEKHSKLLFVCNTQKSRNLYNRSLMIDDNEYSYDLGLDIYYEEMNTYMSDRKFMIFVSGNIILEVLILFGLIRKKTY